MARLVYGGAIAVILLGLYAYTSWYAIDAANCLSSPHCNKGYSENLNIGYRTILATVGALVAATVITELAITKPGQAPGGRLAAPGATAFAKKVATVVAGLYFVVWLVFGLWSLIVGFLQHPGVVPVLTFSGKSWLGVAVAAGYSYFGVAPPSDEGA